MKKIITSFAALFALTAQASTFEEIVSARVSLVEPMTQMVYHRVPKQSCVVTQSIPNSGGDSRLVERCSTYQDQIINQRIIGYKVTFEHKGVQRQVVMSYDPGKNVMVRLVTQMYVLE